MTRPDFVAEFRPGAGPFYEERASLVIPSTAGATSGASAPDHASFDIAGDPTVIARAIGPWASPGSVLPLVFRDGAFALYLTAEGRLAFWWTSPAGEHTVEAATPFPGFRNGTDLKVRAWLDVNNGAGGWTCYLQTTDDGGATWEDLYQESDNSATTSIVAAATPILVGHGWYTSTSAWPGEFFEAQVYDGVTSIVDADFTAQTAGATSFVDADGRTWNVIGDAYLTDSGGIPWVDLSDRVRSASWSVGRTPDMADYPPGEATLLLHNHDRLLDPDNTSGAYFGQLLPRVPFRLRATDDGGATHDDLFYGFVEDGWEQIPGHPEDGVCRVRLVDLLGVLAGYTLRGVFTSAVMRYGPIGYWLLANVEGEEVPDLGSGEHDAQIESDPEAAPPLFAGMGSSLLFDGVNDRLQVHRYGVLPDVFHASAVLVFATGEPAGLTQAHMVFQQTDGRVTTGSTDFLAYVHTDGMLRFQHAVAGGGFTHEAGPVDDNEPHIVFMQSNYPAGSNYGIGLDTTTLDTATIVGIDQGGKGTGIGGTPLSVEGYDDNYFPGRIGAVALYPFPLPQAARDDIYAARAGLDGSRSDQVIAWALDQIGVPDSFRNLDQGRSIMGAPDPEGRDALEFMREVTATEYGALYVDHADGGRLRFRERHAPWLEARATTPQAVFSDDPAALFADVVRVEPGTLVVEANGVAPITNRATVSWLGGEETAEDGASVAAYGPRSTTFATQASSPGAARSIAQWIARLNAEPIARIRRLGIDPGAAESAFPTAIGLRIGDLVTYRSQPQATGSVTTKALTVEGIAHNVEGMRWTVSYATGTAPGSLVDLFILDASELDGTHVLAL